MRADWTGSGGCTSGSTAPPRGATRRVSGGAATTSTRSAERRGGCRWRNRGTGDLATLGFRASLPASLLRRLGAALRRQRGGDDRLVRVHVGDGRDADARRLDDVDGVDADAGTAWRHGLRLGLHCSYCCAGLTALLLVSGVMELRAMAGVAVAVTVERLAPAGERVARAIGAVVVGAGLTLIARAAALG